VIRHFAENTPRSLGLIGGAIRAAIAPMGLSCFARQRRQVYAVCASLTAFRRNEGPGRAVRREATGAQSRRLSANPSLRGCPRFQQWPD
jgi:hypothetical protein